MKKSSLLFYSCLILILVSCTPSIILPPATLTSHPLEFVPAATSTSTPSVPLPTARPTFRPQVPINQTTSGTVPQDEIWRGEILITGDIEIPSGVTLTVEPGTTVHFTAQRDDRSSGGTEDLAIPERIYFPNDPPAIPANMIVIIVRGTLVASGTTDHPIIFTSDSATPSLTDWQSIAIEGDGKLTLEYATLEYNYWGIQLNSNQPDVIITHDTFRHIATCGICTGSHPIETQVVIADDTFQDCHHEGVDGHGDQNLIVRHNLFLDSVVGVVANDGSTILIEDNIFRNNRTGISINHNGNGPTIRGNEFSRNTFFAIWLWENSTATIIGNNFLYNTGNIGVGNSNLNVNAGNNWWGTSNDSEIRYLIQDGQDLPGLGIVDYKPFATGPFTLGTP
jgi:parallel beta-helix repeat protein